MFKILNVNALEGMEKKLLEMTELGVRRKLGTFAETFLLEMIKTSPVNTGEFLASFKVQTTSRGSSEGPQGPRAWVRGGSFNSAIEAENRQRAINTIFSNYDTGIFKEPFRKFYIVNGAPHAAQIEYGGAKDFTSGNHRGIIASAFQAALTAAKVRKP